MVHLMKRALFLVLKVFHVPTCLIYCVLGKQLAMYLPLHTILDSLFDSLMKLERQLSKDALQNTESHLYNCIQVVSSKEYGKSI
jgi:hypothetical protein